MKYLLPILLFSIFCKAQSYGNYVKITAVRVVDTNRVGHTVLTGFIDENTYVSRYLQAFQDDDEQLALALISLKKEAKKWQKRPLANEKKNYSTKLRVPNMFVVQVNRFRDTIFTTSNNASIYFPDEEMEYLDPGNYLNGLLSEKMCFFTERNFKDEFATHRNDSISAAAVLINNKSIYGQNRKSFEKNIEKFQRVVTDSVFNEEISIEKQFWINNYRIKFDNKISNLDAYFLPGVQYIKDIRMSINGIKLGDSEEKLFYAFPCSTEYRNWGAAVSDISRNYYYTVHLDKDKGFVIFYIKDNLIDKIEVEFR